MNLDFIVILTTSPDIETSRKISNSLVENRLAACVNIIPGIESIYLWNEKLCHESEFLLIIKTGKDLYNSVESMIRTLHPYELPEIISLEIYNGFEKYLDWIEKSVQ